MTSLPIQMPWDLARTRWAAILNALLGNPIVNGSILTQQVLKAGTNIISHKLGRKLQGYIVILNSAAATFYDEQSSNQSPQLTLVLVASAPTTVSLYVF